MSGPAGQEAARVRAAEVRTAFVINPVAGRHVARIERRQKVEDFVRHHRLRATIDISRQGGHARELARSAVSDGAELVVSVGGDGTMNEVAGALVGTPVLYGMVPTGSGNGLGRDLGIPTDLNRALGLLLDGAVRRIDAGVVNGLPFFNVMGLGLDAEIGRRFNLSTSRGFLTYLRIGLGSFLSYRRQLLSFEEESGAVTQVEALLTAVANSSQYGNNARIAPRAELDDGRLDLVSITSGNVLIALSLIVRLFRGSIDRSRWVRSLRGRRFVIQRQMPGPIHTDGEVHDCDAVLEVSTRPRSLRVVVPHLGV